MTSVDQLVVGFDLDMTLIDTAPGFADLLRALGTEIGVALPADDLVKRLGPPIDVMLSPYVEAGDMARVTDRFRALYPTHAITGVPALPGAYEAMAAVRDLGGRVIIATGKYPPNAQLHVDHLGFDIDHLEGWVWGAGKADVLRAQGASVYVGDHVHDVEGAIAAGVVSVSVLTGGCSREELLEAGTHVVLDSLVEFPAWLTDHLGER